MRAIITKQNPDGSYDTVGTNNRCLISHLKTERGIIKWACGYANDKAHKIELFTNIYASPYKVLECAA